MPGLRAFSLVQTADQWYRTAYRDTFFDPGSGAVELAWSRPDATDAAGTAPPGAGLAFDAECRLYRSVPDEGRLERFRWRASDPLGPRAEQPTPVDLFEDESASGLGDFAAAEVDAGALREPRGIALDEDDRLYVTEAASRLVLVYDIFSRRLLRRVALSTLPPQHAPADGTDGTDMAGARCDPAWSLRRGAAVAGARPVDVAVHGRTAWVVADGLGSLLRMTAREGPTPQPLPDGVGGPFRIAISPAGLRVLLARAGSADARVVPLDGGMEAFDVPRATDIEFESDDTLVVARHGGEDFLRFRISAQARVQVAPLVARGYRGDGIVRTPNGRIGYWTQHGFRTAVAARLRYVAAGEVTTFRLDSGEFQSPWGRVILDACIPTGTAVLISCVTADESPDDGFGEPTLARTPPDNVESLVLRRPDLSPPMPPLSAQPPVVAWQPLHRRESGHEQAWVRPEPGDPFVTYEAPVIASPGRYLWVTLRLEGSTRLTPRVRSLRAEHQSHDHLRRLPRFFSRDQAEASFLRRYLAVADGLLAELEAGAALRRSLVDPRATPEEMLPWLASFVGLVLDERWPVDARRQLIAEVAWLFRFRGTVRGLKRFLEIYLGFPVVLVEKFQLRGLGGAILGEAGPVTSRAVLGAGFRVGGLLGEESESPLEGSVEDAFRTHAHRFSVLIPGVLGEEQLDVVTHVLEVHRPAHTMFDICTARTGMRVGRGLHVGLSSIIGRSGGFAPLQLGAAVLGREAIVGRPEPGTRPSASVLGRDSRVG